MLGPAPAPNQFRNGIHALRGNRINDGLSRWPGYASSSELDYILALHRQADLDYDGA